MFGFKMCIKDHISLLPPTTFVVLYSSIDVQVFHRSLLRRYGKVNMKLPLTNIEQTWTATQSDMF